MKRRAEEKSRGEDTPINRYRDAFQILLNARENLINQMAEEILMNQEAILGDPTQTGLLGFEFQEIEDRYIGRLNAINSILDNLEPRPTRIANKTEVIVTSEKELKKDLDRLIEQYDQWELVSVNATALAGEQLLVVVAFTADEYPQAEE